MAGTLQLPFVDLSSPDRASTARSIREACLEFGFFYLVNHGIERKVFDQVFRESKRFFSLPLDEKMKSGHDKEYRGYTPSYVEKLDPSLKSKGDSKEMFMIGPEKGSKSLVDANRWPSEGLEDLPSWRTTMVSFYEKVLLVGKELVFLIALALNLDEQFFENIGAFHIPMPFLRLLHYEGEPRHGDKYGASAHSDYGMVTLLATDGVPGLQICRQKDRQPQLWEDVPYVDGALIVNVGDMLERWTNCLFRSTLHRVLLVGKERYSAAFFLDPNSDCLVECLESCCSETCPPRYISMLDIIDLSSIAPKRLKIIDFRIFASMWCGLNMDKTCFGNLCCAMCSMGSTSTNANYCKFMLSGLYGNVNQCVHAVEEDCRTTVWTYQQENDGSLDSFQPDKQLQKRKNVSYIRKHRDLYKTFGPGSQAEMAKILAFGSLFTSPYKGSELYIDIHEAPRDSRIQSLIEDIEFLPFSQEIIYAGREIAQNKIKEPFLCAQLRLLDGQFKNHWKATFSELEQELRFLQSEHERNKVNGLIHIFIMTDLPTSNWTGTYLEELANDSKSYKLYTLHKNEELVVHAAKRLMAAEHGLKSGFLPRNIRSMNKDRVCSHATLPDILLYIEEIVCSCSSVGFVGTAGSTIAESIFLMRKNNICKF